MRALAGKRQRAVRLAIELHAQRHQVVDDRTAGANHDVHALAAVLVMPRAHGVLKKGIVIVALRQHADAALGKHGVALVQLSL